jgi:hypothetical protein
MLRNTEKLFKSPKECRSFSFVLGDRAILLHGRNDFHVKVSAISRLFLTTRQVLLLLSFF